MVPIMTTKKRTPRLRISRNDGMSHLKVEDVQLVINQPVVDGAPLEDAEMKALQNELEQRWISDLMAMMRAAGNDTRMRILYLLWRKGEVRVNDVATILDLTTPAISQQLKKLRESGAVLPRRDAQTIYYRLNAESSLVNCLNDFFSRASSTLAPTL